MLRAAAASAVPDIINAGKQAKTGSDLQRECVYAIGLIAESAAKSFHPADVEEFLPVLEQTLRSRDRRIREVSAYTTGRLAPVIATRTHSEHVQQTLSVLLSTAADPEPKVERAAVEALGLLADHHAFEDGGSRAVQVIGDTLLHAVREPGDDFRDVRTNACQALKRFGPAAARAVPDLQAAVQNPNDPVVQQAAADALGHIGEPAHAASEDLRNALANGSSDVQHAAASALGLIHSETAKTLPALIAALRDRNQEVVEAARSAIDNFLHDPAAFPALVEAVRDSDPSVSASAARALAMLIENTENDQKLTFVSIREAEDAVQDAFKKSRQGDAAHGDVSAALVKIQKIYSQRRARFWLGLWNGHKRVALILLGLAAYSIALLIVKFVVLHKWPLRVLALNEALGTNTSEWPGKIQVPLKYVIPVGFFHYSKRVLDAWVNERLHAGEARFKNKHNVRIRRTYVPLPVMVDGDGGSTPGITADSFRHVSDDHWCTRIIGEGGLGKTTLACQIALRAMSEDPTKRLCGTGRMLPILLEPGVGSQVLREELSLKDAILLEIKGVSGLEPIPEQGFLDRLLQTGRILLILDGVSEMDDSIEGEQWHRLELMVSKLAVSALVVTCRSPAPFASINHTDIHPLRIDTNHLSPFINAYLSQAGVALPDLDVLSACVKLRWLVKDRGITPLLARLYVEALIGFCKADRPLCELPSTVPDLMLAYLNELNRKPTDPRIEDATVHRAAKSAAWECMMPSLRPGRADRAKVLRLLNAGSIKPEVLDFLEQRLHVIETVPPAKTEIEFMMDPIAEYLAGLHALDLYGSDERKWRQFIRMVQNANEGPTTIQEFLIAVLDCIQARADLIRVPASIIEEISRYAQE
jgi:HEAT repeat protein